MLNEVRKLVDAQPFIPFTIHLADGKELRVPTVDHVAVPPTVNRVFVFGDDGDWNVISPLLITRLATDRHPA